MIQDNRLMPLPNVPERGLERPLQDLAMQKPYRYYGAATADATHLRDYWRIVMKRKWIILTLVLIATSLATVLMYREPSIYQAQSLLEIEPKKDSVLKTSKDGGLVINTNTKDPAYINTQLRLLQSPALARQVILTLGLQNDANFLRGHVSSSLGATVRRLFAREAPGPNGSQPAPATGSGLTPVSEDEAKGVQFSPQQLAQLEPYEDALRDYLETEQMPLTNLIIIKYKHASPEMAQKIVNQLADTFVFNNQARDLTSSEKNLETLSQKVAELQQQVKEKVLKRYNYIKANGLPQNESPAANLEADRLLQLSKQLADTENERKEAQSQYEALRNRKPEDMAAQAQNNSAYVENLRQQLSKLHQQRKGLLVTYTEEWPAVKQINEEIKQVQSDLDKVLAQRPREIMSGALSEAKARYDAAAQKEQMLRQSFTQARAAYSGQNGNMLDLSMMNQDLETDKQYLNTLQQRLREMEGTSGDQTRVNNIKVQEYSRQPNAPIGPPRLRNILIASLLSLFAGVGLAFLLHYLDDTVKTIDDVDRYLHLPALALIPTNRPERRLKGDAPADSTALALIDDARSPQAEAYRHLRTSLLLSSAGQPPKSILVTSSQPSEGKTTTAVNTAIMLAQTGATVAVLDCDLRRPRLHAHFQVSNQRGITNFLSGDTDLAGMLQPHPKLPNLHVLASGPVPPNPAELLGSDQMRKLLILLTQRFTHVVVDSPPCISFTDASILSTMVDGVMLVIHSGRSSRAIVRRAKQQLTDVGAHIFGVVLNNVKAKESDYYYYGGYYSSYYEDAGEDDE